MQEFTGLDYLKIDIANNFGHDKLDYSDRIKWFDNEELQGNMPLRMAEAKEPSLFFAGYRAYQEARQGKPIGYPVSLDASSSGLQIFAALIGCRKSAQVCGLVNTGHRAAAYRIIYEEMLRRTGEEGNLTYDQVKKAIMTSLYSSKAEPRNIFGKGTVLLNTFYQVVEDVIPGAWTINSFLESLWQSYELSHDWVLPDNFHVHVKVDDTTNVAFAFMGESFTSGVKVNRGTKTGLSLAPNIAHSLDAFIVREMGRRCSYDPSVVGAVTKAVSSRKARVRNDRAKDTMLARLALLHTSSGYLSARVLDYIDDQNAGLIDREALLKLLASLPKNRFDVLFNHD